MSTSTTPNPYRVAINVYSTQKYGYLVQTDSALHKIISEITFQALSAMELHKARLALQEIAKVWAEKRQPDLPVDKVVEKFQKMLQAAMTCQKDWLTIVIDWTLPDHLDGRHVRSSPYNKTHGFDISQQYISLNGLVSLIKAPSSNPIP